ncbi:MAG: YraN family protein [Calothrix sp. SM1_5_4]|nr:YraN family protein [Calothrix sp. SM1_5_4]
MPALRELGWRVLYHDVRIAQVQVDILARTPRGLLCLVEVKARSELSHLSLAQERRLRRIGGILAQFEPVEIWLASVSRDHKVALIPVDGLTENEDMGHLRG